MSCEGTWADAIIIQAVANCLSLRIHIAESLATFAPVTIVQSVTGECASIYVGHIGEAHYVSTAQKQVSQISNKNKIDMTLTGSKDITDQKEKHKAYMKEYMRKRRTDPNFRNKEKKKICENRYKKIEAEKRNKTASKRRMANADHVREINRQSSKRRRAENLEHIREIKRQSFQKRKAENPEHIREINKQSILKRKAENTEHIRQLGKQSFQKRKAQNPEHIREINKQSMLKRKAENTEHIRQIGKQSFQKRKAENPKHIKEINKRSFQKRKAGNPEHIREIRRNCRLRNTIRNSHKSAESFQNAQNMSAPISDDSNGLQIQTKSNKGVASMINSFHQNIQCGPEYICTCCDQLWYRTSVVKCDLKKYVAWSQDIVKLCVTGLKIVEDTEWICSTCDANLKKGKLPSCSKANKMMFPKKPEVLNLTPLEERLISPRIPFMQIRELPRGGQLSIHGNIVNVPSDINSTVQCLPRPITESQTIPIKLKRRLSYKHHYQFQNIPPKKVLDAAKYLVETSDLFKKEGIIVQNAWVDKINLQSNVCDDWNEFVEDSDPSSGNLQTNGMAELAENVNIHDNNNITVNTSSSSGADNTVCSERDDDVDGWCEVEERPSGLQIHYYRNLI